MMLPSHGGSRSPSRLSSSPKVTPLTGLPMSSTTIHEDSDEISPTPSSASGSHPPRNGTPPPFNILGIYKRLMTDEDLPMPIAAVSALTELVAASSAQTMSELVHELQAGAEKLKKGTANPVSLSAGCDLFIRYVTTMQQEHDDFALHKLELVTQGRAYAKNLPTDCRDKISKYALGFIQDDAVILTHSYSRVVMQALLCAHRARKRISVFVTEARPRGLGVKTYNLLERLQIPCTLILDTAVAYIMDKVDVVLVGCEAVVESGGLINALGTAGLAVLARDGGRPFYALAESYKFLRHFPLSQYDLPNLPSYLPVPAQHPTYLHPPNSGPNTPGPSVILSRSSSRSGSALSTPQIPSTPSRDLPLSLVSAQSSPSSKGFFASRAIGAGHLGASGLEMTPEHVAKNPEVDYTRPELISLVVSDVGILTPQGVSGYLVGIFAD